jgi:hypothetical protein
MTSGIMTHNIPIGGGPSIVWDTCYEILEVGIRRIGVFEYTKLLSHGIAIHDLPTRSRPSIQWTCGRDIHRRRKSRPRAKSIGVCGSSGYWGAEGQVIRAL